jgi:hypothetical protein
VIHGAGTPLPDLPCPYCGVTLECADGVPTNVNDRPTAGAVSVCIACAEPSLFVEGPFGLAFRKPTPRERASIMDQIGPALLKYKMMRASRPGGGSS